MWELASTLETAVKGDVAGWTAEPTAIVETLREPVYIDRYLRVLATIKGSTAAMPALLAAVRHISRTPLGAHEAEPQPDRS